MDPLKFLLVLHGRYKVALAIFVLTVAAGLLTNHFAPKRYIAETVVMVDVRDPVAGLLMPQMMTQTSIGTQLDIIHSDRVGRKVVKILRLDENPEVVALWRSATEGKGTLDDWMSALLRKGLKVNPSRDSSVLTISYQGADPKFVAAVVNAFAQAYIEASVELKVEPARQYSQWFADQAKTLRENVEKAQSRLSEFQRQKGIVATDESLDSERAKLRELNERLTAVQVGIRDSQSKERTGSGAAATLPEVMQNPAVQQLRTSVNQLEVKLKEAGGNLGRKHPQYQRMELELAELKERLAAEIAHASKSYSSTATASRLNEKELRAAIDAQTRRVLAMNRERDEIAVLMRDVDTAKRAHEAVTARLTQTQLESQATRANVSVLTPAIEPIAPSFPMPAAKAGMISLLFGLVLAGAAIVGLEILDRRVRTAEDLAEMLQIPVLAVIKASPSPRRTPPALPAPPRLLPRG